MKARFDFWIASDPPGNDIMPPMTSVYWLDGTVIRGSAGPIPGSIESGLFRRSRQLKEADSAVIS